MLSAKRLPLPLYTFTLTFYFLFQSHLRTLIPNVNQPPLVIYHKQLGDVLMMEPALAKLAASTGGIVHLSTRPSFASMVSLMPHVKLANYTSFRRASSVYSFSERFQAAFKALIARSSEKRLFAIVQEHIRPWHHLVYHSGCFVTPRTANYQAEHFFNSIPGPSPFPFRPPQLRVPPADWLPSGLPPKYVLLHGSAAWQRKAWPAQNWAAVLNELHAEGIGPFVLTGGTEAWERELAAAIQLSTKAPVLNLSGKTSLKEYLATIAFAQMALCVDGSATHLAAAFKRPSVSLFGPTPAERWFYKTPSSVLVDARSFTTEERPAVSCIPIGAVTTAVLDLWAKNTS